MDNIFFVLRGWTLAKGLKAKKLASSWLVLATKTFVLIYWLAGWLGVWLNSMLSEGWFLQAMAVHTTPIASCPELSTVHISIVGSIITIFTSRLEDPLG